MWKRNEYAKIEVKISKHLNCEYIFANDFIQITLIVNI